MPPSDIYPGTEWKFLGAASDIYLGAEDIPPNFSRKFPKGVFPKFTEYYSPTFSKKSPLTLRKRGL